MKFTPRVLAVSVAPGMWKQLSGLTRAHPHLETKRPLGAALAHDEGTVVRFQANAVSQDIGCTPRPRCLICNQEGNLIHRNLPDHLFSAKGSWNVKKCNDPACGLIWLDPMPLPEEIGKAYVSYYTHASEARNRDEPLRRRIATLAKRGHWSSRYGYAADKNHPLLAKILGWFLYLSPIHRRQADAEIRCLPAKPGGRLLDVGCGAGDWMMTMRERGWDVDGLDFDEIAVRAAAASGLRVRIGSLEDQRFPDCSFDAVTLSHVIEHVPDPIHTMRECLRILKPGGKVILLTPNNESLSHRVFKASWRGLEPPRHMHVFSLASMRRLLSQSGFRTVSVLPFIVTSVIHDSLQLLWRRPKGYGRDWPAWALARIFKVVELALIKLDPTVGDCIIAVAEKD